MRRAIVAFAVGIIALQFVASLPSVWWLLASLAVLTAARWLWLKGFPTARGQCASKLLLVFLTGLLYATAMAQWRLSDALPHALELKEIEVIGVVASLPEPTERGIRFIFDVEHASEAPVPHHIQLSVYGAAASAALDLAPGQRWRFNVALKRPHGNANPHGFDYEAWLLHRGIRATGSVRRPAAAQKMAEHVWRLGYTLDYMRFLISRRFDRVLGSAEYKGVLKALAVGDQQEITRDQWLLFTRTGINHLVSISGLHVTMIAALFAWLAMVLWRRSGRLVARLPAVRVGAVAGVCAAFAYAALAGFSVPTQRTVYMLTAVAVMAALGRFQSASRVLAVALLVVLVLDPWAAVAPGFWLSFGAVAAIFYFTMHRTGRDRKLTAWFRTQWAVTLGLMAPLLAMFGQLSLVSPLANAIAIPVVSLVVVPLTLLGAIPPFDALLHGAEAVMEVTAQLLKRLDAVPWAVWQQPRPGTMALVLGLVGTVVLLLPRGIPARWLGAVLLIPLLAVPVSRPGVGAFRMTVLDVGQGLAVVVETHRRTLLFDTGPSFGKETDAGNRVVVPYMRAIGLSGLDALVVSHDDADHSGGAQSVMDAFPPRQLLSSLGAAHKLALGRAHIPCVAGQWWRWDNVTFTMMNPAGSDYRPDISDNNKGCVLRVATPRHSVLLAADIERPAEQALIDRYGASLRSDVLVVPHHGSKTSSTEDFLDAVKPQLALISAGYRNRYGHPKESILERYRARHSQIYRTDQSGALTLEFDNGPIRIEQFRVRHAHYWME